MVIHHLNCGTLRPIGARFVNGYGGLMEPARLVSHCLLLELSDRLVLVDTGLGTADMEDPWSRLGRLPAGLLRVEQDRTRAAVRQLAVLGFEPNDVRDIVMTHLDCDHAGGLADFPWADVHVLDVEQEAALHPVSRKDRERYSRVQFAHGPKWAIHHMTSGERWFGFDYVRVFAVKDEEVLLIPLLGHSRGHCGVAVQDGGRWLLHAGDAFMHHDELDLFEPQAPFGIRMFERLMADDWGATLEGQSLLRQLAHDQLGVVHVVCSHDPALFDAAPSSLKAAAYVG